ncbi:GGDEF domain-containing protein [Aeromonas enteropelogenes]|uniref:GGDEF domain-containing protein n=1 Tax=Aeromonas enteropelogenes TaxID=29489 RepID=UPI003F7491F2
MGRRRHNGLLIAIILLFLISSGCGLYLQHKQDQLLDTYYRNVHWNISQVMLESQRFLFDLRLYRAGRLEMETLSLHYDLLWNRLDIFLIGSETAEVRERYGLGRHVARLFEQLKQLEPLMDGGTVPWREFDILLAQMGEQTRQIEQIGEHILSGQEREASVNQIRDTLFWLQIWQLVLLATGGVLVYALIRANLQNRRLSLSDPLTRLGNRRALQEELARALQTPGVLALVVLDLKRFKQVNDLLGYQVGDRLLQTVASKLQQAHQGNAYRLGGDEFAVILTAGKQPLAVQIRDLMALLHFEFVTRESRFDLDCRLGGSEVLPPQDPVRLLDQAILALNQAKRDGSSEPVWYQPGMQQQLMLNQQQTQRLRDWLADEAPCPLLIDRLALCSEQGERLWQWSLRWQENLAPCEVSWLQEGGLLGPVMARLLQEDDTAASERESRLVALDNQVQLAHLLAYLPDVLPNPLVLRVPTLQQEAALLARVQACGCVLALAELGSSTPATLAAGWPVRYWLPEPATHGDLLQPLANRLGLQWLRPVDTSEANNPANP